jgi:hypothetical protein
MRVGRWLVLIVVTLGLTASAQAEAIPAMQPPPTTEVDTNLRSGPALAAGIGNQFAGYGANLDYYFRFDASRWALTPYAGGGTQTGDDLGAVVGVMVMYGDEWHWLLDAGFGAVATHKLALFGEVVDTRALYGANLSLGAEWMGSSGILVRLLLGVAVITDPYLDTDSFDQRLDLAGGLGVGWKPW